MTEHRLDIAQLHEAVTVLASEPGGVAEFLRGLLVALDRAAAGGSDSITWLADCEVDACAIVPARWARALAELMRDPGGEIAQRLGSGELAEIIPYARSRCPVCRSPGAPAGGCQDLWHIEVRPARRRALER